MTAVRLIDRQAVFTAVSPERAIEAVRDGFTRYAAGEWTMPAKAYLDAPAVEF